MKKYDIVVCGGGLAGCAAAIAAARRGMKCALIEKTVFPGGLATSGLVLVYLPLCDGKGRQVMFGLAEELLHLSNKYGPVDIPSNWKSGKKRLSVHFSPASFVLALDELLENSGVDIWYDTLVIGCTVEEKQFRRIRIANKSGIMEIEAERFIDATGDADLAYMAGHPCQTATNALVSWIVEHRESNDSSTFTFGENVSTRIMSRPIDSVYTRPGIDGKMVTDFLLAGRRDYRRELEADYLAGKESRKSRYPLLLPTMVPMRHTRSIQGKFVLDSDMGDQDFEDSVGLAAEWRGIGPVWSIPYRTLLPAEIKGLLAAGRCISSIRDAWEITRVIPTVALTGEAAGIAASLSLQNGVQADALPYAILSKELRAAGFPLLLSDIYRS